MGARTAQGQNRAAQGRAGQGTAWHGRGNHNKLENVAKCIRQRCGWLPVPSLEANKKKTYSSRSSLPQTAVDTNSDTVIHHTTPVGFANSLGWLLYIPDVDRTSYCVSIACPPWDVRWPGYFRGSAHPALLIPSTRYCSTYRLMSHMQRPAPESRGDRLGNNKRHHLQPRSPRVPAITAAARPLPLPLMLVLVLMLVMSRAD